MKITIDGLEVRCMKCGKILDLVSTRKNVQGYLSVKRRPVCRNCNLKECKEFNQEVLEKLQKAYAEE